MYLCISIPPASRLLIQEMTLQVTQFTKKCQSKKNILFYRKEKRRKMQMHSSNCCSACETGKWSWRESAGCELSANCNSFICVMRDDDANRNQSLWTDALGKPININIEYVKFKNNKLTHINFARELCLVWSTNIFENFMVHISGFMFSFSTKKTRAQETSASTHKKLN